MIATSLVTSRLFRIIELQVLMDLTARAFGIPPRRIWMLPYDEALRTYAEFTRDNLQGTAQYGRHGKTADTATLHLLRRMSEEAEKTGRWMRRLFCLKNKEDIERFTILIYKNIGIDLKGHIPGQLCFCRCFFSRFYTPDICLAASALDEGIMRGLTGSGSNGSLLFSQRITEGFAHCHATYRLTPDTTTPSH